MPLDTTLALSICTFDLSQVGKQVVCVEYAQDIVPHSSLILGRSTWKNPAAMYGTTVVVRLQMRTRIFRSWITNAP